MNLANTSNIRAFCQHLSSIKHLKRFFEVHWSKWTSYFDMHYKMCDFIHTHTQIHVFLHFLFLHTLHSPLMFTVILLLLQATETREFVITTIKGTTLMVPEACHGATGRGEPPGKEKGTGPLQAALQRSLIQQRLHSRGWPPIPGTGPWPLHEEGKVSVAKVLGSL